MMEDITSQTVAPGMQGHSHSVRGWIEHRSRIGGYRTLAHSAWGIGGALDCLCQGQVHAAKARLYILLLQLDQSAVDRGSWTLASGASSTLHFAAAAQPSTRRGTPLLQAHLQEQDTYQTKRRNLGKATKKEEGDDDKEPNRRKPKAKAKAAPEAGV